MSDDFDICGGCSIKNKHVDGKGIFYCPNPLCMASGASWFRYSLDSFEHVDGSTHKVTNVNEWVVKGIINIDETKDIELKEALLHVMLSSLNRLIGNYAIQNMK